MNSEKIAKDFLLNYGLQSEKFGKEELGSGETPDYRVYKDDELFGYCEVKNPQKDTWLDDKLNKAEPGEIVGGLRKDPVFNRLSGHIHKARKQFDAVNVDEELPNILSFYNEDEQSGFLDLVAVTTGNFFAEGGAIFPIYRHLSEGRIKKDIEKIHLIIWMHINRIAFCLIPCFGGVRWRSWRKDCPSGLGRTCANAPTKNLPHRPGCTSMPSAMSRSARGSASGRCGTRRWRRLSRIIARRLTRSAAP